MRFFLMTAFATCVFVAGYSAMAQSAPSAEPIWLKQPTSQDKAAVFPRTGARLGHSGRVQLSCTVQPDGGLSHCDVLAEEPGDEGFADAALKLVKFYKVASPDGSPLSRSSIAFPVMFSLAP